MTETTNRIAVEGVEGFDITPGVPMKNGPSMGGGEIEVMLIDVDGNPLTLTLLPPHAKAVMEGIKGALNELDKEDDEIA